MKWKSTGEDEYIKIVYVSVVLVPGVSHAAHLDKDVCLVHRLISIDDQREYNRLPLT